MPPVERGTLYNLVDMFNWCCELFGYGTIPAVAPMFFMTDWNCTITLPNNQAGLVQLRIGLASTSSSFPRKTIDLCDSIEASEQSLRYGRQTVQHLSTHLARHFPTKAREYNNLIMILVIHLLSPDEVHCLRRLSTQTWRS